MEKADHNPATSPAHIVRYLAKDPEKNEIVKQVHGQTEALKWLEKLNKNEKEPHKYRYLWQWQDPDAALEYDLRQLKQSSSAGKSKKAR